jgi:hypothetical protein
MSCYDEIGVSTFVNDTSGYVNVTLTDNYLENGPAGVCQPGTFRLFGLCIDAVPDSYSPMYNSEVVYACPVGRYSLAGSPHCSTCGSGYFYNLLSGQCELCHPGTFSSQGDDDIACKECSAGTYQPYYGRSFCYSCWSGSYSSSPGATQCSSCPLGTYSDHYSAKQCHRCHRHFYSRYEGSSSCYGWCTYSYASEQSVATWTAAGAALPWYYGCPNPSNCE